MILLQSSSLSTMMASSLGRITLTSLGFGKDLSQSADYRSQ